MHDCQREPFSLVSRRNAFHAEVRRSGKTNQEYAKGQRGPKRHTAEKVPARDQNIESVAYNNQGATRSLKAANAPKQEPTKFTASVPCYVKSEESLLTTSTNELRSLEVPLQFTCKQERIPAQPVR
jgi:hypothetical protein